MNNKESGSIYSSNAFCLLNPAYCGIVLYDFVSEYQKRSGKGVDFSLVYFILPFVLNDCKKVAIDKSNTIITLINRHPEFVVDIDFDIRSYIEITNDSLEFLISLGLLELKDYDNEICIVRTGKAAVYLSSDDFKVEVKVAKKLARMMANLREVEILYYLLGVKP